MSAARPASTKQASPAPLRNVVWDANGLLAVTVLGVQAPNDAEWAEYIAYWKTIVVRPELKRLVYSMGGWPSTDQRKRLMDVVKDHKKAVAMVTGDPATRTMAGAVRWFNPAWQVFAADDIENAFKYLELDLTERRRARDLIAALQTQLGGSPTKRVR